VRLKEQGHGGKKGSLLLRRRGVEVPPTSELTGVHINALTLGGVDMTTKHREQITANGKVSLINKERGEDPRKANWPFSATGRKQLRRGGEVLSPRNFRVKVGRRGTSFRT